MNENNEKAKIEQLVNWNKLSVILTGKKNFIRSNRKTKKYEDLVDSLLEHIETWASKNNVEL